MVSYALITTAALVRFVLACRYSRAADEIGRHIGWILREGGWSPFTVGMLSCSHMNSSPQLVPWSQERNKIPTSKTDQSENCGHKISFFFFGLCTADRCSVNGDNGRGAESFLWQTFPAGDGNSGR